MKETSKLRPYIINAAVALIMTVCCAMAWDITGKTDPLSVIKILSDSFFLPGVLLAGASVIGWVASKGTFDMFSYTGHNFLNVFKRESYLKHQSFYEYKVAKDEKRKPFNLPRMLVGLGFLTIGIALTVVFMIME